MSALDTIPGEREIARAMIDTWAIDFTNALQSGETVTAADAELETAMFGNDGTAVPGFVLNAVPAGTTGVNVSWSGAGLDVYATYRLKTTATLSSGAVLERLTTIRCIA